MLYVKNMLNEGYHHEELSGEIMARPTKSYIVFVQQLGRVLSKDRDKSPIVLDLVGNIRYFKEFRLEVQEIIKSGIARGETVYDEKVLESFKILEEQEDFIEAFEQIEKSIADYLRGKTVYEQVIEFLETHGGKIMKQALKINGKVIRSAQMTPEQREEVNLYARWKASKERRILKEYEGKQIEEVPEEYREKIARLREFGLGQKEKTTYEEVIEWLETHDGQIMRGYITKNGQTLSVKEMTQEQQKEVKLYNRWLYSKERKILEEYAGKQIEEVPEEYKEKIARLREFGLGQKEKTTYEEVIEWLETHDGQTMRGAISKNGQTLSVKEMTQEQRKEVNLYVRWIYSKERIILEDCAGKPIEEVPEEYRDKIAVLREYGLGQKEKTAYEEVIEWLETHDGQIMRGGIIENGQTLRIKGMTSEQRKEVNLYARWRYSKEKKILEEYAGQPIEEVSEEYREKIARLREFGLGLEKSRLSNAKENRDEAKAQNDEAKKLQKEVSVELKKRGKKHEEQ